MKADILASLLAHSETPGMVSGFTQGSLLQRQQQWACTGRVGIFSQSLSFQHEEKGGKGKFVTGYPFL